MTGVKSPNIRNKKPQHIHDVIPIEYQAQEKGWESKTYDFRNGQIAGADYFNPGLLRRQDGDWLIVRCSVRTPAIQVGVNSLIAFSLKDNVPITGWPISIPKSHSEEQFEDARICRIGDKDYITCCHFYMPSPTSWSGARILLVEASNANPKNPFASSLRRIAVNYGGNGTSWSDRKSPQKNWLPHDFEGRLHVLYSASPHINIEVDSAGRVVKEHKSEVDLSVWKYGVIRGGTPPVRIGDEYLTFFHSSTQWVDKFRQYHMGAYTFEAKPPFRITKITPEPLLSGSKWDLWFPGKPIVVFPCGSILNEKSEWLVSFGINDLKSGWVKIPHSTLLPLCKSVG